MMKPLYDYKAALFDLDGTLVDSLSVWENLCRDWLRARGIDAPKSLEHDIELMTLTQAAEYVRRLFAIPLTRQEIIDGWLELALWQYQQKVDLKPGIAEQLQDLADHGLKLAVVTSSFPEACRAVLERHGLLSLFAAIIYTDEAPGDKRKPQIWRRAARRLGVEPGDCVVFEDLAAAEQGARAAGMDFILACE